MVYNTDFLFFFYCSYALKLQKGMQAKENDYSEGMQTDGRNDYQEWVKSSYKLYSVAIVELAIEQK